MFSWVTTTTVPRIVQKEHASALKSAVSDMAGAAPSRSEKTYMRPSMLPPERNRRANSTHRLSRLEVQRAINDVKRFMEDRLATDLHLTKVSIL
jgi:hypothetical protein